MCVKKVSVIRVHDMKEPLKASCKETGQGATEGILQRDKILEEPTEGILQKKQH